MSFSLWVIFSDKSVIEKLFETGKDIHKKNEILMWRKNKSYRKRSKATLIII